MLKEIRTAAGRLWSNVWVRWSAIIGGGGVLMDTLDLFRWLGSNWQWAVDQADSGIARVLFAAVIIVMLWHGIRQVLAAEKQQVPLIRAENEQHRRNMLAEFDSAFQRCANTFAPSERIAQYVVAKDRHERRQRLLHQVEAEYKVLAEVCDNWRQEHSQMLHRGFRGLRELLEQIERILTGDESATWQWPPEHAALGTLDCPYTATEYEGGQLKVLKTQVARKITQFRNFLENEDRRLAQ